MRRAIGALLLATGVGGCGYGQMAQLREAVDTTWVRLDQALEQRTELIGSLLDATRSASRESAFTAVANARARLLAGGTREQKMAATKATAAALAELLALVAARPDLGANEQVAGLARQLTDLEARIAADGQRYDEAVRDYNAYIATFPHSLYASAVGFEPQQVFEPPPPTTGVSAAETRTLDG